MSLHLGSIDGGAQAGLWAAITMAALWGLAGGFSHCIGMCGIFVLSCGPIDEPNTVTRLWRHTLFQLGRMIVLVALGVAAGEIGSLVGLAAKIARAQGILAVGCGVLLALLAMGYVGIMPRFRIPEPDVMSARGGAGRKLFAAALRDKHLYRPLLLGSLVGLLPCGLTYSILIPAATTLSPARGALVLLSFGLGTIPGLLTLGMAGGLLGARLHSTRFREFMTRSGAVVMLAMGIALIWRGWPNLF
jgi:uncharacterized protein